MTVASQLVAHSLRTRHGGGQIRRVAVRLAVIPFALHVAVDSLEFVDSLGLL